TSPRHRSSSCSRTCSPRARRVRETRGSCWRWDPVSARSWCCSNGDRVPGLSRAVRGGADGGAPALAAQRPDRASARRDRERRDPVPLDGGSPRALPALLRRRGVAAVRSLPRNPGFHLRRLGPVRPGSALVGHLLPRLALERAGDRGSRSDLRAARGSLSIPPASQLRSRDRRDGLRPSRARRLDFGARLLYPQRPLAPRTHPHRGESPRASVGTGVCRSAEVLSAWMKCSARSLACCATSWKCPESRGPRTTWSTTCTWPRWA